MATPTHRLESSLGHERSVSASLPIYQQWDLEDERILIDIETDMASRSHMESTLEKPAGRIPHFLLEGRTLGPLSVLLILVVYSLLSPLLPPAIHEYIHHILH